jgi:hypothetical protein
VPKKVILRKAQGNRKTQKNENEINRGSKGKRCKNKYETESKKNWCRKNIEEKEGKEREMETGRRYKDKSNVNSSLCTARRHVEGQVV